MTGAWVTVERAAALLATRFADRLIDLVLAEQAGRDAPDVVIRLSPGMTGAGEARLSRFEARREWADAWAAVDARSIAGLDVEWKRISVEQVSEQVPSALRVNSLDGGRELAAIVGTPWPDDPIEQVRAAARLMVEHDLALSAPTLRAVARLGPADRAATVRAVAWLRQQSDLGAWTARQVPVPGVDSKWIERHGTLVRLLLGRDVRAEVRPRLAVVHLTYLDPVYLRSGGRRHDAWTQGDLHELAYLPTTVLVVENRDCRLWFPETDGAIVVEGEGKGAASLLADVPWVRGAQTLAYWGDIDADGFAILDRFREAMTAVSSAGRPPREVPSILMDLPTLARFSDQAVDRDSVGRDLPSSTATLRHLDGPERAAYHAIQTAGPAEVRRLEQERIPLGEAAAALVRLRSGASAEHC